MNYVLLERMIILILVVLSKTNVKIHQGIRGDNVKIQITDLINK